VAGAVLEARDLPEDEMKTSMFEKGTLMLARARTLVGALFAVVFFAGAGCFTGGFGNTNVSEGDRCNPLDSHNECASGLVCTGQASLSSPAVPFCPENYCCSVDGNGNINSTNPNCQPGCAGGAASICKGNADPGACAFAGGASLKVALAMDMDAGTTAPTPDAGGAGD
jgi:hypothetical protein